MVRKPLVALVACGMVASSLALVSPANATEIDSAPTAAQTENLETETPVTETPVVVTPPAATPATPAASKPAKPAASKPKKRTTPSKYTKAPSLAQVRAGKATLKIGMQGPAVRTVQKRLIDAGYFKLKANGIYGESTGKAVDGIREKNFYSESTTTTNRVVKALWSMTGKKNRVPGICKRQKQALCTSKKQKVLRYYKKGKLIRVFDVRFGQTRKTPTRNGNFRVFNKIADGTSSLSRTWMPWALYFSGGQAIHYSPGFKAVGYYGASLGCVNVRDYKGVKWLYKKVPRGTFVKVYK